MVLVVPSKQSSEEDKLYCPYGDDEVNEPKLQNHLHTSCLA
jgi:hypothetical protein